MYVQYWNLREKPFQNVLDLRFTYFASQHQEGLARLIYLAKNQKTGGIIIGPYGVGKSTILELLAKDILTDNQSKYLCSSMMFGETLALARYVLKFVGYNGELKDMTGSLEILQNIVAGTKYEFPHMVLAIDDAQLIVDAKTWQFLHLLSNITVPPRGNSPLRSAFTIILCGQTDLVEHLKSYPALAQRMQFAWRLTPLAENQTIEYIQQRMRAAGGDIWVFADDAMRAIHWAANGLPRVINNICDTALMLGFAGKSQKITKEIAEQAVADTQFGLLADTAMQNPEGEHNG
jgi:general secretion pathway protein A